MNAKLPETGQIPAHIRPGAPIVVARIDGSTATGFVSTVRVPLPGGTRYRLTVVLPDTHPAEIIGAEIEGTKVLAREINGTPIGIAPRLSVRAAAGGAL